MQLLSSNAGRFFSSYTPTQNDMDFLNEFIEKIRTDPKCVDDTRTKTKSYTKTKTSTNDVITYLTENKENYLKGDDVIKL
jgi:hypothetical protein